MSRSLEQQARRYLRLFPEWMREVRGEEAVGLVLDQLPADRDRLPLRSKVDLVRAGLHARRKGTPPPWVLRTASRAPGTWPGRGAAVPAAWRPWLIARLRHRSFVWQCAFMPDLTSAPTLILLAVMWSPDWGAAAFGIMAGVAVGTWFLRGVGFLVFRRSIWRARLTSANGLDPDGVPLPPGEVAVGWNKPAMRNVWVLPFAVAVTVTACAAPVGWMVLASGSKAPSAVHPWEWSVGLVALGLAVACTWAVILVRRLDPSAPPAGGGPCTDGGHNLAETLALGLLHGAVLDVVVVVPGVGAGLHASFALVAPLAALVATLVVAGAQRSLRRAIGAWDLLPGARPQPIVRRLEDLPPPPGKPDTPAYG
jgi:hypothetical protein